MRFNRIGIAGAVVAATLGMASPALAQSQPGDFKARFYGTCTNTPYVAFWRIDPPEGVDPHSYGPDLVEVDVNYQPIKSEVMYAGDYDEVHRFFHHNRVPKTMQVYLDDTLVAERTYWCGFYKRSR